MSPGERYRDRVFPDDYAIGSVDIIMSADIDKNNTAVINEFKYNTAIKGTTECL